jgi:hypothetical protein
MVSTLLCVTDSRRNHPFARPDGPDLAALTREDLVATFLDVAAPETSALLAVIGEMAGDDDVLRTRVRRELAARPTVEPAWLAQLSETSTYRAVRMSHVLGDGDNIMLGARLAGGHELTCLVYIDHNLGTLVKDAFVVPESDAMRDGVVARRYALPRRPPRTAGVLPARRRRSARAWPLRRSVAARSRCRKRCSARSPPPGCLVMGVQFSQCLVGSTNSACPRRFTVAPVADPNVA